MKTLYVNVIGGVCYFQNKPEDLEVLVIDHDVLKSQFIQYAIDNNIIEDTWDPMNEIPNSQELFQKVVDKVKEGFTYQQSIENVFSSEGILLF
jgi:hypothetical protein